MALHITHGKAKKHPQTLATCAQNDGVVTWTMPSKAIPGDTLLVYILDPMKKIVAIATVDEKPKKETRGEWKGKYMGSLSSIRMLDGISLEELQEKFPDWGWPRMPRSATAVPPSVERVLRREVESRIVDPGLWLGEGEMDKASVVEVEPKEKSSHRNGAGFGTPENNAKVEKAAIKFVIQDYKGRGWTVESVEAENRGYDLLCRKGKREEHVEVKGVSGSSNEVILTANEERASEANPLFVLAIVANALSKKPRLTSYRRHELLASFAFEPVAYRLKWIS